MGAKFFLESYLNNNAGKKAEHEIYAVALDNIFATMKGFTIFERFGFDLLKIYRNGKTTIARDFVEWIFEPKVFDWITQY